MVLDYLCVSVICLFPQVVLGYLGLHNLRKGKTGLYTIKQLNYLMRSKLHYDGPPVIYNARLNDNNIEVVFPNMDVLRAVVEKLSPITVSTIRCLYLLPSGQYLH